MIVKYTINYGGYYGSEEEYEVEVDDNATTGEIEKAIEEDFEEQIHDNCNWELVDEEDD